ncbi:ABC transporter permease [Deinococcus aquiradiocola]|uniref:ABC transporter permease n=1 Tax=Deinococcus aquiradiocola TaxID=393059 RepID=A0A917PFT3_9DEIO|nr:ABC transporter permease [Deinococcus aquiradiocola]GGJ75344.1 ABC transporter permease [Deinococcus aquiradiocola]
MRNVLLIAELSLREALRKRLVLILLVLTALFVGFYLYGILRLQHALDDRAISAGLDVRPEGGRRGLTGASVAFSAIFGMYLVYFLGSLMSVLSTVGAVSGDIESGVMQSVVSRPVSRGQLVVGRWLGFSIVNVAYVALLSAALLVGVRVITGFTSPQPFAAVALVLVAVLLLTSLTVLGSTVFSTLSNGIGVFVLYGLGFTGGILSTIGQFAATPVLVTLGNLANTLMPSNALWLGASYHLQPDYVLRLNELARGANPFISTTPISAGTVVWALAYALLALVLAVLAFRRRDL